jgi:hypothetical protein
VVKNIGRPSFDDFAERNGGLPITPRTGRVRRVVKNIGTPRFDDLTERNEGVPITAVFLPGTCIGTPKKTSTKIDVLLGVPIEVGLKSTACKRNPLNPRRRNV